MVASPFWMLYGMQDEVLESWEFRVVGSDSMHPDS